MVQKIRESIFYLQKRGKGFIERCINIPPLRTALLQVVMKHKGV